MEFQKNYQPQTRPDYGEQISRAIVDALKYRLNGDAEIQIKITDRVALVRFFDESDQKVGMQKFIVPIGNKLD